MLCIIAINLPLAQNGAMQPINWFADIHVYIGENPILT